MLLFVPRELTATEVPNGDDHDAEQPSMPTFSRGELQLVSSSDSLFSEMESAETCVFKALKQLHFVPA